MASWVAKKCKSTITIKYPTGTFSDGKPTFSDVSALARISDLSISEIGIFGNVQNAKSFLVAPLSTAPPVGSKITHTGVTYDLKSVKTYTNCKDEVMAYKCIAVGG